jgi:hypothetical protein
VRAAITRDDALAPLLLRSVTRAAGRASQHVQLQRTCCASCATGHVCAADQTKDDEHSDTLVAALRQAVVARAAVRGAVCARWWDTPQLSPDQPVAIERDYELSPGMFVKEMDAPAEPEKERCQEFPGGSTDCEVDDDDGTPTGRVSSRIDESNPCSKPCVERHEAVHVKQLKKLCGQLRDCYRSADRGARPVSDCWKMAVARSAKSECEAYKVSVPCMESRLKNAACKGANKDYALEKLASERCWRDHYCG